MKVHIGKYPSPMQCKIFTKHMDERYGFIKWPEEYSRYEKFLKKLLVSTHKFSVNRESNARFADKMGIHLCTYTLHILKRMCKKMWNVFLYIRRKVGLHYIKCNYLCIAFLCKISVW